MQTYPRLVVLMAILIIIYVLLLYYSHQAFDISNIAIQSVEIQSHSEYVRIPYLIFQVGFHKCGTRSLYDFFSRNNIASVHNAAFSPDLYNINGSKKKKTVTLSKIMNKLYESNESVLSNLSDRYAFYSDYGRETTIDSIAWYEILSKQYPNSKFILGIRNINHWLRSRYTHFSNGPGAFIVDLETSRYTEKWPQNVDDLDKDAIILNNWHVSWYKYICDLLAYFEQNHLRENLVIWDLEYDDFGKLVHFFKSHNLPLKVFSSHHKGSTSKLKRNETVTQLEKWQNITIRYPKFKISQNEDDEFNNEYDRIREHCNDALAK